MANKKGKRTPHYHLYKPIPGEGDVAGDLNDNLDIIDQTLKNLSENKADSNDKTHEHDHDELYAPLEHGHDEFVSLSELVKLFTFNNINANNIVGNISSGNLAESLIISATTDPPMIFTKFDVRIRSQISGMELIPWTFMLNGWIMFTDNHIEALGVKDNEFITIDIRLTVSGKFATRTFSHKYQKGKIIHPPEPPGDPGGADCVGDHALEEIIEALSEHDGFVQLICNKLQFNNTISRKVAEFLRKT